MFVRIVLLIGSLACVIPQAFAQVLDHETGKWVIEGHAGLRVSELPRRAKTSTTPVGETFTTGNNRPSRYVPSWYFGDGAALLNEQLGGFAAPRINRLTPLDPVLTASSVKSSRTATFGVRVGRRLTSRFTAELNLDYSTSPLKLNERALKDVEASRATFEAVFREAYTANPALFSNVVVTSLSEINERSGRQLTAIPALTMKLKQGGALLPYVTGGLGGVFSRDAETRATLKGNYSFIYIGDPISESDTVTVRWVRPHRSFVGLAGTGFTYDVSRRHGIRVDVRLQMKPNAVDTEVSANSSIVVGTPARRLASATTPSIQYSNNPELTGGRSSLSGPPISSLRTREGQGWEFDPALTLGYYWKF